MADLFDIGGQDGSQNFRLSAVRIADIHSLHRIQLSLHPGCQRLLHLRIPAIAQPECKTNHGGFADGQRFPQLRRRHKHRLIVMIQNIGSNRLMPLAHPGILLVDPGNDIVPVFHSLLPPVLLISALPLLSILTDSGVWCQLNAWCRAFPYSMQMLTADVAPKSRISLQTQGIG